MANPQGRPTDLAGRFLQYLHEERAMALEQKESAVRAYKEANKRLLALEKEIEYINGEEVD